MSISEEELHGYTIRIVYDTNPESPREWDNLGTMACFHRRYQLGDTHGFSDSSELIEFIQSPEIISLPLYLYDHSGITMNTTGFTCPWDSGQVGYIYVSKEKVRKEYSRQRISKAFLEQVKNYLKGEVEVFDNYISGEVYGYVIEDEEGTEIDSCYGYYGEEEVLSDARNLVNALHLEKVEKEKAVSSKMVQTIQKHSKQLKAWIRNGVPLFDRRPLQIS